MEQEKSLSERISNITAALSETYSPKDENQIGRCDLQLVMDSLYAVRVELHEDPTRAGEEVGNFLGTVQGILQGMAGDIRDLETSAHELSTCLNRVRGPHIPTQCKKGDGQ
jgi:hypothetical protein